MTGEVIKMKRITIIGGGASGTLVAVNLIKNSGDRPIEVNLVERSSAVGRGVAYGTDQDVHLLNVPAAKIGAFPDAVGHFYEWLVKNDFAYAPGDFVPRYIYGEYLRSVFSETVRYRQPNCQLNILDDEAIDVLPDKGSALVLLRSGEALPSHKVVLAFGNFLPPKIPSSSEDYLASEKYFHNAWDFGSLKNIGTTEDVLVIGTGLTAVDTILALERAGHSGKITALSTHGWLPAVHEPAEEYKIFGDELIGKKSIRQIFASVRRHCRHANNWRSVVDSLRPYTQDIWYGLPVSEKRKFMRHLRRVWDISRHRMPPACHARLREMIAERRLSIKKAKISNIQFDGSSFDIKYTRTGLPHHLRADAVINCIGSESNFAKIEFPLVRSLLERGEIVTDPLALGLNATREGKIINQRNEVSNVIYTLGTTMKGILWESTAMPEIRLQARRLALDLLSE